MIAVAKLVFAGDVSDRKSSQYRPPSGPQSSYYDPYSTYSDPYNTNTWLSSGTSGGQRGFNSASDPNSRLSPQESQSLFDPTQYDGRRHRRSMGMWGVSQPMGGTVRNISVAGDTTPEGAGKGEKEKIYFQSEKIEKSGNETHPKYPKIKTNDFYYQFHKDHLRALSSG